MHNASMTFAVFRHLCRLLGGQCPDVLQDHSVAARLPELLAMACHHDLVPALAARCDALGIDRAMLGVQQSKILKQALLDNTRRNMQISAQALKLAQCLNGVGIRPLFLKGTAALLSRTNANIGFRKQVDIDFVVRPSELHAAGDALLAQGYYYCRFADNSNAVALQPGDTASAIKRSAAHHHLPPLVKPGYAATVELHRHFLDTRFQRRNPLLLLFDDARPCARQGADFLVPSAEYQIIHLILGKLITDGHLARHTFPIREACDLIAVLEQVNGQLDQQLIGQRCGQRFIFFYTLVCELMGFSIDSLPMVPGDIRLYMHIMQKRFESTTVGKGLDAYARIQYLLHALLCSPRKLPGYLRR